MSDCEGLHCPGCKDGKGGKLLAVVVVCAIVAAVVSRYWHDIMETVHIAVIATASAAGAAAVAYVSLAAMRAYANRPIRVKQPRHARVRQYRHSAPIKIVRLGTGATPQHKELMDRMNDDLVRRAAHLTDERVSTSR